MLDLSRLPEAFAKNFKETFFADSGEFARHHYPRHMEAMEATRTYKRCTIFGANRVGKSLGWCYALACFLTGKYPHWWRGRVFSKPIMAWAAGVTATQVRDSLQRYLIGTREQPGAFVAAEDIEAVSWGKDGCAERAIIRSIHGGFSQIEFKTYAMEQERFQSATLDCALMDEEPKAGIYTEAVTRTATTGGLVLTGFTALKGVTPLIAHLLPEFADGKPTDPDESGHWYTFIGWDDIPLAHLSAKDRAETIASYLPHEIDARTKGIPRLGSGKVWPVDEREFVIPHFEIPDSWPRIAAIDPGYQDPTGMLWGAVDMESDTLYLYAEYRKNLQPLPVHVDVVHRRGDWIPCVIDYAGANITDGKGVFEQYRNALHNPCYPANKNLTEGLAEVYDRMLGSRFYVLDTLSLWRQEYATYSRDDKGRIMDRTQDHHYDLMAATRYLVMGLKYAKQRPPGWKPNNHHMRAYDASLPQQSLSLTDAIF